MDLFHECPAMESGNSDASSKGVLIPVSDESDVFKNSILTPLQSAYLYEESRQSFKYKSAVLIKNPTLEEKYNTFRAKRRELGYSVEDLKETYGFLLFDDVNKAYALRETGVLSGNDACTTLGDPSKGVYISVYSDCLDLNRWYHGKSGYIAIIRLTKGKVKYVSENYTQNFTAPTPGFDCHVSEQLHSVSAETSSFLAFERTQYYMYELLDDGNGNTSLSPSAACPFAIVSFSYTDTKATLLIPQEKSEEKKTVCHYLAWRGELQIGTQLYNVGLRSTARALVIGKLPPVVKVDKAISMLDLRQLLPRAVFETCFSCEVFVDGLYCSLCELVPSETEETSLFSLLLQEIKDKDLALPVPLNDSGFLILLHSSHFLTYDDGNWSNATEVLQGLFVFPHSQLIQRDTKLGGRKAAVSSEILQALPALSYAEAEAEKTSIDPGVELCEVLVQHMHSYAALLNPGLALSPSRDVSIFSDEYDVPDAHKHLYSSSEWSPSKWQIFRSYLSKPLSFQLPVSKASEILAAGQEDEREDLDDDVYICLSSPEEAPANLVGMESEDEFTVHKSASAETSVDNCITSAEAKVDLNTVPWQAECATNDTEISDLNVLIKNDMGGRSLLNLHSSDDLPSELIVSITSAKRTVTDESVGVITTATKHNDFELSAFSTTKLQTAEVNSLNDEALNCINGDSTEVANVRKTKRRKRSRGRSTRQKKTSKAVLESPTLQTIKIPVENNISMSQKDDMAKQSSGRSQLSNLSKIDWRKLRRRKRKIGKLSSRNKKLKYAAVSVVSDPGQQNLESTISMEFEVCSLRKKTERWDLKPVVSECGRILVPHGSLDFDDQIKFLKEKLCKRSTKDEQCPEKMLVDTSVNANDTSVAVHDTVQNEQETSSALEMTVDKTECTKLTDGVSHFQNDVISHIPEHCLLRQLDYGKDSLPLNPENIQHSTKDDGTDIATSAPLKEKCTGTPKKCATKGEVLLNKIKSILLRGKRKRDLFSEGRTADTAQNTEPCVKKGKGDSDSELLKSKNAIASVQDTNECVKEDSKMLSLDPVFAYALGLTPKEKPNKIQKTEGHDAQLRKLSSERQEHTILDKQPQIIQRPPSIFPRGGRIKMLKKHQGIPTEYVKKKWWLHFQTPATCFATEKLKSKEYTRDNSVRKTVKEKMNNACSSTDALNLLADLALSDSNGQVQPQPDPALEKKPETSLKKCNLTKDVTSAEQESVLHSLLRKPTARPIKPLESPSSQHLVGGTELVDLTFKEHAYSLPPSSCLLLGLPGTPFQVSPLNGSTRLLYQHQQLYGNGIQTLHPSVCQESRGENNHRTPEYLKKHMVQRQNFRRCHTFVNKNESIQVTRHWKDNYDFNLDSKFTSDPKDRTILRALHGPWDFSIQDTSEEMRLIVHMWIGLFYSRSTARFFHIDSNLWSETSDSLEMFTGMSSAPAQSEVKASSSSPDTSDSSISKALDLSKNKNSVLDQRAMILDFSLRNSNAQTLSSVPQLNTFKSLMGLHEDSAFQCYKKMVQSTESIDKVNDARSINENQKMCTPLRRAGLLKHTDVPSFKSYGSFIPPQEETEIVHIEPENVETSSVIDSFLCGSKKEKTDWKDGIENSGSTEMSLPQKQAAVTDELMESNNAVDEVPCTTEQGELESKVEANPEMTENPYNTEPPKVIDLGDCSNTKESFVVCNGNCLENEDKSLNEEPKALFPGQADNKGVDCFTVNEEVEESTEEEKTKDASTQKDQFHHWPQSPQCEKKSETLAKEIDLKMDKTNEGFEKVHRGVVIPFIGIDTSGEDLEQPHVSHPQNKVEELAQGPNKIPFIGETTYHSLPTDVCGASQINSEKIELSAGKVSLYDLSETKQPLVFGSVSDDRCPTPTLDEKPSEYTLYSGPTMYQNITENCLSRKATPVKDEVPHDKKHCHKSTVNREPSPHCGLHPDLELRTLRVLKSINKFISKHDKSKQMATGTKLCLDQTPKPSSKRIATCLPPSHTSDDFKCKKRSKTKPKMMFVSASQQLHPGSSEHFLLSPFKNNLEEVLGGTLQLKKTDSSFPLHYFERTDTFQETSVGDDHCHSYTSFPSACLQTIEPNIDHDAHKTSQSSSSHEHRSYSQRPVMAVKQSKSDEKQAHYIYKDGQIEKVENTESVKGRSEGLSGDKNKASELSSQSNWLSNVCDSKSHSDGIKFAHLDPSYHYQERDISAFNKGASSSQSMLSVGSAKTSSKFVDGNQGYFMSSFVEKVCQITKEKKDCSDASASFVHRIRDDSLTLGSDTSLMCTVYNTRWKKCHSFLEKVSKRCIQDDLTQATVEQEYLIFYEQMKQLLKRSKRGPISQQDAHDKLKLSCASPITVHFSSLEEQEDSLDHFDALSLAQQKIKVDMSDRKDLADTTEKEKTLDVRGTGNPAEHVGVSGVTEECSRHYETMMNDVCAVKKVPSRSKYFKTDRPNPKAESCNNFDFCVQMKREMDESFHNHLNSVVRKFCKTKYRFYILVTSDDDFFEETKAQLETQGHVAVEPSEFFHGDESSSLLIILRNEDIAGHIFEVPHLLELKKAPGVQFAGIDEPDDVINLTHQELFTRGGFIMFNKETLGSLSLSNMKKCSDILQELSRTGKWKWMLHYRDSRWLKENARLSAEAKEKMHFLNRCQDTGILEVLPYHECDLMTTDQPDYLTCLAHLQVQNISARYPVLITDTLADSGFGRIGILTMTLDSFLTISPSETFAA